MLPTRGSMILPYSPSPLPPLFSNYSPHSNTHRTIAHKSLRGLTIQFIFCSFPRLPIIRVWPRSIIIIHHRTRGEYGRSLEFHCHVCDRKSNLRIEKFTKRKFRASRYDRIYSICLSSCLCPPLAEIFVSLVRYLSLSA